MADAEKMPSRPVPGSETPPALPMATVAPPGPARTAEDEKSRPGTPSPPSSAVRTPSRTPSPELPQTTTTTTTSGAPAGARGPSLDQAADHGPAAASADPAPARPHNLTYARSVSLASLDDDSVEGANPTLAERLAAADGHWAWKVGIRASVCVVAAVGIGCAVWIMVRAIPMKADGWTGAYVYDWVPAFVGLVVFAVSVVWGTADMLVRFRRRSLRPIHPGVIVGVDLVLFVILVCLLAYSIPAARTVAGFGSNPEYMRDPVTHWLYDGNYFLNRTTDTWEYRIHRIFPDKTFMEWNATSGEWYAPSAIPGYKVQRTCRGVWDYGFADCAAQDAFVNGIWRQKPTRLAVDVTLCVAEALLLAGHFALFVWACVDCARRNRVEPARALARQMVADMVDRGELLIPDRRGAGAVAVAPQPAAFTPVPAHLLRRRRRRGEEGGQQRDDDPSHWESLYGAYDPVDGPRGDDRAQQRPHVPFQQAPYVLPYGRGTPGWRSQPGPAAAPVVQDREVVRYA